MEVKLEKFEGPLTLLLQLIEKEEMDITRISLGTLADQYIEFVKKEENIDPDLAADFLVIATKLLFLKSKTLLPYLSPEEEEEAEDLEQQLKMFKEFVDASQKIKEKIKNKEFMYTSQLGKKERMELLAGEDHFSPPQNLQQEDMKNIMWELAEKSRSQLTPALEEEEVEYKVNIEEKIKDIQNKMMKKIKCSFHKIVEGGGSKTEMIVSFLAMLELAKQKSIHIEQEEAFADIIICDPSKDSHS